jgi:hypothetical protein
MKFKILFFLFSFVFIYGTSEVTVKTEVTWYDNFCSLIKIVGFFGGVSSVIFYLKNEEFKADIDRLFRELSEKIAKAESPLKHVSFEKKTKKED